MIVKFYIEDALIDLFPDDTIELNNSIANTDDITKVNTDYTRTFSCPASDRNNFIFKHYYDADIDNSFDARVKKNASITLDGLPFKTGRCRLEKVAIKNGKPSSYSITFWGNLVNLKDAVGDDYLRDLDLTSLEHAYNSTEVKNRLVSSGDLVYNLFSNARQYFYDSTTTNNINTATQVNIAYNGNARGIYWNELKPSIRLYRIIQAIQAKYGFNFSTDFFNREDFFNLYMLCNNTSEDITVKRLIDFTGSATDIFTVTSWFRDFDDKRQNTFSIAFNPDAGFIDKEYTLIVKDGTVEISRNTFKGNQVYNFNANSTEEKTWNISIEVESKSQISYSGSLRVVETEYGLAPTDTSYAIATQVITGNFSIYRNIPKLKVIDFLNGIIKMSKLVVVPAADGTIYVNTLNDYYQNGEVKDLTRYLDSKNYDVSRGVLTNQIDFRYEEPTTFLNKKFKLDNIVAYGDEDLQLKDDLGKPLDGDKIEVKLPFENILFERLTDAKDNTKTNVQYGLLLDDNLKANTTKPVIFYNVNSQLGPTNISFLNSSGVSESLNGNINTPSSTLGLETSNYSILWGNEFSPWNGNLITGTLFSNYWQKYIQDIFNIKKRNFSFEAKLPSLILTKLQLNDIVKINSDYYRINDYTVNLINGKAKLNLINNFDTNFNLFAPSQKTIYTTFQSQLISVYVSNSQGITMGITLQDLGFGTSWVTATQNNSFIDINLTENTLGFNREIFINVNNGSGKSFQIYLNQDNKGITSDSNIIKSDTNLITSDNG